MVDSPQFPCPHCGNRLPTAKARQCLSCGMDWHDPANVVQNGDPDWNLFGLDANKTYVVELLQHPDGRRTIGYRESSLPLSELATLETESATGQQFIDWGYYTYSQHLRLTDGRSFGFDAHGVWLTQTELEVLKDPHSRHGDTPWENGIAPLFAPK